MRVCPISGLIKVVILLCLPECHSDASWYYHVVNEFSLAGPYILPTNRPPYDLEVIPECYCPRVYWPACASNNITYVNACILLCVINNTNYKMVRDGPCIMYRRNNLVNYDVALPEEWRNNRKDVYIGHKGTAGTRRTAGGDVAKLVTINITAPGDLVNVGVFPNNQKKRMAKVSLSNSTRVIWGKS